MRTGLPAALLRGTPSAIRDDRFTRCPFPAATIHAPVALARSSNTAMEHRNRCTDLRHPELLATSLLKCPRQDCCETPSETKKIEKLSPLSSFIFLTLRGRPQIDTELRVLIRRMSVDNPLWGRATHPRRTDSLRPESQRRTVSRLRLRHFREK